MRYLRGDILLVVCLIVMRVAAAAEPEFQILFVEVRLNGVLVADNALLLRDADGRLLARVADIEAWRLRPPPGPPFIDQGEAFAALDDLLGLRYDFEPATLVLEIDAPTVLFEETVLTQRRAGPPPQGGTGAYLNYDLLYQTGDQSEARIDGLFEVVAFRPHDLGVLSSDLLAEDLDGDANVTRLNTTWSKDLIDARKSIYAGDATTAGTILSRPLRFGGVRWTTNFALDPTFITTPAQTIGGIADGPSVVEVFVNDALRYTADVPRGPFEIDRIPGISGQGEVRLVVRDLLGREQIVTGSFFFSPDNLAAGLADFSYEAGVLRENFGTESFDYGRPFAAATYRRGLTDGLTGEVHIELQEELQVAGLGGILVVPKLGRFRANVLGSDGVSGTGSRRGISYEYIASPLSLGIGTEYTTPEFRQMGAIIGTVPVARTDRASLGLGLGRYGSLGLVYVNQEIRDSEDQSVLSGGYRLGLPFGSLLISGTRSFEPDRTTTVGATIVVPLGADRTFSANAVKQDRRRGGGFDYQKNLGSSELGHAYRIGAHRDEDVERYSGDVMLQTGINRMTANAVRIEEDDSYRLGMSGGLSFIGGGAFLSRPIDQSFALVDAGGVEGITVYRENRKVGTTNEDGRLLVPNLIPYDTNRLALESSEIPFEAAAGSLEETAVPYDRSGVVVNFDVRLTRSATLTVVDAAGEPLPPGSRIRSEDGRIDTWIATKGLAYLTDLGVGEERFIVSTRDRECRFVFVVPEELGLLPHLGEATCR